MSNSQILSFAKEQVAAQSEIDVSKVRNDTIVINPTAIRVAVENKGDTINFPNKDFLKEVTWGDILAANPTGSTPTADYSP